MKKTNLNDVVSLEGKTKWEKVLIIITAFGTLSAGVASLFKAIGFNEYVRHKFRTEERTQKQQYDKENREARAKDRHQANVEKFEMDKIRRREMKQEAIELEKTRQQIKLETKRKERQEKQREQECINEQKRQQERQKKEQIKLRNQRIVSLSKKGLKQDEIAKQVGVSRKTVNKVLGKNKH